MEEWIRSRLTPRRRVTIAFWLLIFTLVGWPATHVLILVARPPESSWVFHLLLALSWLALTFSALTVLVATDVRREQDS